MTLHCRLHIDGAVVGKIVSNNLISIGKSGVLEGEVRARKLVVTGRFQGEADCDEIEILAGGRVSGEIRSKVLVIERGSHFEGNSSLREPGADQVAPPVAVADGPSAA
ncbi:MAG: polymer-forming cytoskeletal protein [Magnetococcales bacterium]|nr:polymer-forming cytoskeletal protein [Magnetococcales bacterium]